MIRCKSLYTIKPFSELFPNESILSHRRLGKIIDRFMINQMNTWFKNNGKITDFVRIERNRRGLDDIHTLIESSVYGINNNNSTFHLMIKKYGKEFIHLSIHLAPDFLSTSLKDSGIIHIVKNI
jgi:hypothetical protein